MEYNLSSARKNPYIEQPENEEPKAEAENQPCAQCTAYESDLGIVGVILLVVAFVGPIIGMLVGLFVGRKISK